MSYPAFSKMRAARTMLLFVGLKAQTILIVVVTVLTMQKSKTISDRWNLWPLFPLSSWMVKCVTAPIRKRIKNTTVIGTSSEVVGIPPKIASPGVKGPRVGCFIAITGMPDAELDDAISGRAVGLEPRIEVGDCDAARAEITPAADGACDPPSDPPPFGLLEVGRFGFTVGVEIDCDNLEVIAGDCVGPAARVSVMVINGGVEEVSVMVINGGVEESSVMVTVRTAGCSVANGEVAPRIVVDDNDDGRKEIGVEIADDN